MTTKVVSATVAMAAAGTVAALPPWSWDTLQTYVHCANYTGEWNDEALAVLAKQPFVVFEKYHKAFEQPQFDRAESKIVESCRKVKRLNPKTDCYIYTESDWARTEYSLGHWFDAHPSAELQCPSPGDFVGTNDTLCGWEAGADYSANRSRKPCNGQLKHLHYRAYDFNNSDAREKWIERVTNATSSGVVDGAFIDGNRGGFGSSVTGHCSAEKRTGWAAGLEQAVATLSRRLGPSKTLISNYPTPDAMKLVVGGMMERGGSTHSIEAFGKKTCGLFNQTCLLDYHAQYFREPSDGKLANFLLGMQKYSYFGGGSGWGGPGPGACALWLKQFPEYSKALGEPKSDRVATTASWPGAVCDTTSNKGDTSGCLWSRVFASGTKVFAGQYLPKDDPERPRNQGACIYWSDGTVTTDNVTRCQPKERISGGY